MITSVALVLPGKSPAPMVTTAEVAVVVSTVAPETRVISKAVANGVPSRLTTTSCVAFRGGHELRRLRRRCRR